MFKRLLLVATAVFAYGSNLTLKANNKVSYTPNYSYSLPFIDYEAPAFRLGDYHTFDIESVYAGGGQVSYMRIRAHLPGLVFDELAQYENVFIYIPNYQYNSAVDLVMRIDTSTPPYSPVLPATYPEELPLVETMLQLFPYTVVDIPHTHNVYDRNVWVNNYGTYFRITFVIPYTAYTQPPSDYAEQLKNITLFTKRADGYSGGYDDGYTHGYYDGYRDGDEWGYQDGYLDGYDIGFADAESVADGSWLGSLVFGTIGGIVGFLFALSDFEVLGVSIMSIITLFVAIGIVKLLLKVLN